MDDVPFVDLRRQHVALRAEIQRAVDEVLDTAQFILGDAVRRFEVAFARYVGASDAIGVGSGLDALRLALTAVGLGAGDEVIVPANSFVATALAVSATGARPVFVDCDDATAGMTAAGVEHALSPRTRAIVPVHLYGQAPADCEALLALATRTGVGVIEDAAQAHGARVGDRHCGTLGRAGCFSFYPTKNLGACGDGGMVVTNDADLAERIRVLRDYGQQPKGHHIVPGTNSRLDALQAAILTVKLPHLDRWNDLRRGHAAVYTSALADSGLTLPTVGRRNTHVFHLYTVRSPQRDALRRHLTSLGIHVGIHYPVPIHLQPAYADGRFPASALPTAERMARETLSLPMFPELTAVQRDRVIAAIVAFDRAGA